MLRFQVHITIPWVKIIEHTEGFYSISQVSEMTGIPIGTLSKNPHYPKPAKRVGEINMRLYTLEQVEQIKTMNQEFAEYLTMQRAARAIGCSPSSIRKFEGSIFPKPIKILGDNKAVRYFTKKQVKNMKQSWKAKEPSSQNEIISQYNKKGYYTIKQVADLLEVGQTTLRRYEGSLLPAPDIRVGPTQLRMYKKKTIAKIDTILLNRKTLGMIEAANREGRYTITQTAKQLGIDRRTLSAQIGKLYPKPRQIGGRFKFYTKDQIEVIKRRLKGQKNDKS